MRVARSHFRDRYRYGIAQASEVAAPALRVLARVASRGAPSTPREWRSGVILGNGHIGDVLYRTCSLDALHAGLPACRWTYVTSVAGAETLAGNPALHEILAWTDDSDRINARRSTELRRRGFDVALCSDNVAHHRALLQSVALGIPNRVAHVRKGLSGLATIGVECNDVISYAAAFRAMVETVTGQVVTGPLRPRIFPSAAAGESAVAELRAVTGPGNALTVVCAPTTRQTIGRFSSGFFVDVMSRVLSRAPEARVVLTGVAAERPMLEPIAAALGSRAHVSAGRLSVLAFGAFLGLCDAFLGTDSGARHLANAAGVPVFFVRNMGTTEAETGSYCDTETDVAPAGEYMSRREIERALLTVDRDRVAASIVSAASERAAGTSRDTLL